METGEKNGKCQVAGGKELQSGCFGSEKYENPGKEGGAAVRLDRFRVFFGFFL